MSNLPFLMECVRHFSRADERELYLRLYSPDVVLHGYGLAPDIDAVRAHYEQLWTGFPDVTLRTDDIFESGDKVASRFAVI
jgi:hypothetical protein